MMPLPVNRVPHECICVRSLRPGLSTTMTEDNSTTAALPGDSLRTAAQTLRNSSTLSPASLPSTYRVVVSGADSTWILNIVNTSAHGNAPVGPIPLLCFQGFGL